MTVTVNEPIAYGLFTRQSQYVISSDVGASGGSQPTSVPSLALDFVGDKVLPSSVTFTRASTGTYYGADGLLKTATTNEARFDHDPSTGVSKGLLIEEARTNLLTYSEQFDNAAWSKQNLDIDGTPPYVDVAVAPNGATTADKLIETTATGGHSIYRYVSASTSTTYTVSLYIKADTRTSIRLQIYTDGGTDGARVIANASTGAVETPTVFGSMTGPVASITSVGNGWYRVSLTATTKASGVTLITSQVILYNGSTDSYTGDGTSGIYIWGAQLEAGAFPTSYIPTTTASATRAADVASMTGTNFSSWYNQTEGTFVVSADKTASGGAFPIELLVSDNSVNNYLAVIHNSAASYRRYTAVISGGVQQVNIDTADSAFAFSTIVTSAFGYKTNDFAFSRSGEVAQIDTSGTVPAVDRLHFGQRHDGAIPLNGHISRITYFPTRLSDTTLQALSQ